ncbi:VTT domain-containing protein [uncultured Gemmobacter sp.]|uniref:YqaA family protein n=1 Tax=uncultured Gemmobacter sp. TaxID=1095917 RepID=UPI000B2484FD|nr:VTT domain-containing protein [uncultured Gemmobacter sp.]
MFLALAGLMLAAFLAATPLPMQSEAVFVGLQLAGSAPVVPMILLAGLANTAGSAVTWAMGRGARTLEHRLRLPAEKLARAEVWYRRWGKLSLLLSWAPLGDVICLLAGAFRVPLWQFLLIVGFAKTARYAVLAGLTAGVISWGWT